MDLHPDLREEIGFIFSIDNPTIQDHILLDSDHAVNLIITTVVNWLIERDFFTTFKHDLTF